MGVEAMVRILVSLSLLAAVPRLLLTPAHAAPLADVTRASTPQTPIVAQKQTIEVRVKRAFQLRDLVGEVEIKYNDRPWQQAKSGFELTNVGEQVKTGKRSRVSLQMDLGIGAIQLAPSSLIQLRGISVQSDQSRLSLFNLPYGSARIKLRRFTNPNTRFELQTPAGLSSVRGTEFGIAVQPAGKTSVAVLDGRVNTSAQGVSVDVDAGFQNFTIPGQPPSEPVPLQNNTDLEFTTERTFTGIRRQLVGVGQVDPVNMVFVNGELTDTDADGRFRVPLPSVNFPKLQVLVQTPLGDEKNYDLQVQL